MKITIKEG